MASLSYATAGTGPSAGGIGWVNFGTFSIAAATTVTGITATLRDGSILKFNLSNAAGGGTVVASPVPTYSGAPFGNSGYFQVTVQY